MVFSAMALCSAAVAQGCGQISIDEGDITCCNGTEKQEDHSCGGSGDPSYFCSEGHGECCGTEYGTTNVTYDPDECGGGGGGGGCPPDKCSCADGTCSTDCCDQVRSRSSSAAAKLRLRPAGGYYRNGTVYDGLPFALLYAKKTAGLPDVLCVADVSPSERGKLIGGL
jgi:hypothetical protein